MSAHSHVPARAAYLEHLTTNIWVTHRILEMEVDTYKNVLSYNIFTLNQSLHQASGQPSKHKMIFLKSNYKLSSWKS